MRIPPGPGTCTDFIGASGAAATTIRELFRKLEEDYPGMAPHLARGVAVSINGKIFRDNWQEPLPEGAEIYLLPRIQGG